MTTHDMACELVRNCWHFTQLRTWIHYNNCDLTIKSDTGQHLQFLRCFLKKKISWNSEDISTFARLGLIKRKTFPKIHPKMKIEPVIKDGFNHLDIFFNFNCAKISFWQEHITTLTITGALVWCVAVTGAATCYRHLGRWWPQKAGLEMGWDVLTKEICILLDITFSQRRGLTC